jgi:hypothetical protein
VARSLLGADAEVRRHVLALRRDHQALFTRTLGGVGTEWGDYAHRQFAGGIDALIDGDDVAIHRYELPDSHPQAAGKSGHPSDYLVLGADDIVREL